MKRKIHNKGRPDDSPSAAIFGDYARSRTVRYTCSFTSHKTEMVDTSDPATRRVLAGIMHGVPAGIDRIDFHNELKDFHDDHHGKLRQLVMAWIGALRHAHGEIFKRCTFDVWLAHDLMHGTFGGDRMHIYLVAPKGGKLPPPALLRVLDDVHYPTREIPSTADKATRAWLQATIRARKKRNPVDRNVELLEHAPTPWLRITEGHIKHEWDFERFSLGFLGRASHLFQAHHKLRPDTDDPYEQMSRGLFEREIRCFTWETTEPKAPISPAFQKKLAKAKAKIADAKSKNSTKGSPMPKTGTGVTSSRPKGMSVHEKKLSGNSRTKLESWVDELLFGGPGDHDPDDDESPFYRPDPDVDPK